MKLFEKIAAWIANRKRESRAAAEERAERITERRVQLREFRHSLYIAVDGMPITMVEPNNAMAALYGARRTFLSYLQQQK